MAFTRSRTALTLRRLPLSDRSFLPHDQGKGRIRVSLSLYSRRGWDFNFGFRWQHIASGDTIQSMTVVTRNMQPTCHLYFIHPSCCHDEHHLGGGPCQVGTSAPSWLRLPLLGFNASQPVLFHYLACYGQRQTKRMSSVLSLSGGGVSLSPWIASLFDKQAHL